MTKRIISEDPNLYNYLIKNEIQGGVTHLKEYKHLIKSQNNNNDKINNNSLSSVDKSSIDELDTNSVEENVSVLNANINKNNSIKIKEDTDIDSSNKSNTFLLTATKIQMGDKIESDNPKNKNNSLEKITETAINEKNTNVHNTSISKHSPINKNKVNYNNYSINLSRNNTFKLNSKEILNNPRLSVITNNKELFAKLNKEPDNNKDDIYNKNNKRFYNRYNSLIGRNEEKIKVSNPDLKGLISEISQGGHYAPYFSRCKNCNERNNNFYNIISENNANGILKCIGNERK